MPLSCDRCMRGKSVDFNELSDNVRVRPMPRCIVQADAVNADYK
jgi:hypothetical protein